MDFGSLLEVAAVVLASAVWLFKKWRDRREKERRAARGEPEFQRNYEPIEVYGGKSRHREGD